MCTPVTVRDGVGTLQGASAGAKVTSHGIDELPGCAKPIATW